VDQFSGTTAWAIHDQSFLKETINTEVFKVQFVLEN
jgi:hypothetical protein